MKPTEQSVPSRETGATSGDFARRQSIAWKNKGGRNATTEESRRAAGQIAPRPQSSKAQYLSSSSATAPSQAGLGRVADASSSPTGRRGPAGSFGPPQTNAYANLQGTAAPIQSGALAPAPRGGPPGIRAGGRNQTWPNGAMYTDAIKAGGSGRDPGPVATRRPKRMGKGAAFYGEY